MTGRPRNNRSLATWIAATAFVVMVANVALAEDSTDKPEAADALIKKSFASELVLPPPHKDLPMPVSFRTKRQNPNSGD